MKQMDRFLGEMFVGIIIGGLLFSSCGSSKRMETKAVNDSEEVASVTDLESIPVFRGDLNRYLSKNVKYPADALKQKIQGKVYVQFIIETDGSITNARVLRSVHPLLDAEALRVIRNMPNWKPGIQRGKPVRVSYMVPVGFRLD
jgi:tonB family C-terminal domain